MPLVADCLKRASSKEPRAKSLELRPVAASTSPSGGFRHTRGAQRVLRGRNTSGGSKIAAGLACSALDCLFFPNCLGPLFGAVKWNTYTVRAGSTAFFWQKKRFLLNETLEPSVRVVSLRRSFPRRKTHDPFQRMPVEWKLLPLQAFRFRYCWPLSFRVGTACAWCSIARRGQRCAGSIRGVVLRGVGRGRGPACHADLPP